MPYTKGQSVPAVDSALNLNIRQVIGNKSDTHDGNSIKAMTHIMDEHTHKEQKVYPTLADGVTLSSGAGDWGLGTIVQIVPISTIDSDFDIHEIVIEAVNTADKTYELVLYAGADDTEVGRVRFAAGSVRGGVPNVNMQTPIIAKNSRIRGKLAIQDGNGKTATISLRYHTY